MQKNLFLLTGIGIAFILSISIAWAVTVNPGPTFINSQTNYTSGTTFNTSSIQVQPNHIYLGSKYYDLATIGGKVAANVTSFYEDQNVTVHVINSSLTNVNMTVAGEATRVSIDGIFYDYGSRWYYINGNNSTLINVQSGKDVFVDFTSQPIVTAQNSIRPPDTVQSGYSVTYTDSTSAINAVLTNIDTLPRITIPDGQVVYILLNTGDLTTCTGFMQVGAAQLDGNGLYFLYMNGTKGCLPHFLSPNGGFAKGHKLTLEIQNGGSTTTYSIFDAKTGKTTSITVPSLSTWNKNDWQSMTESTSVGASIGSTEWDNSQIINSTGITINLDKTNTKLSGFGTYGGACTDVIYSPGAWTNGPTYGYSESSISPTGHCVAQVDNYVSFCDMRFMTCGIVGQPQNIIGGIDGLSTEIYGGNPGDGGNVTTDLVAGSFSNTSFNGTLKIDGYSYNNGRGAYYSEVKVYTSSDCSTFTNIYDQFWTPSQTNTPSWITISSVNNVKCVKVTAADGGSLSANVFIDGLKVGSP